MKNQVFPDLSVFKKMIEDENHSIDELVNYTNQIGGVAYKELISNLFIISPNAEMRDILDNTTQIFLHPHGYAITARIKAIIIKIGSPILDYLEEYLFNVAENDRNSKYLFGEVIKMLGAMGIDGFPLIQKIYRKSKEYTWDIIVTCKEIGDPACQILEDISKDGNISTRIRLEAIDQLIIYGKPVLEQLIEIGKTNNVQINDYFEKIGPGSLDFEIVIPYILSLDDWRRYEHWHSLDKNFNEETVMNFLRKSTTLQRKELVYWLFSLGEKATNCYKCLLLDEDKDVRLKAIQSLINRDHQYGVL